MGQSAAVGPTSFEAATPPLAEATLTKSTLLNSQRLAEATLTTSTLVNSQRLAEVSKMKLLMAVAALPSVVASIMEWVFRPIRRSAVDKATSLAEIPPFL